MDFLYNVGLVADLGNFENILKEQLSSMETKQTPSPDKDNVMKTEDQLWSVLWTLC